MPTSPHCTGAIERAENLAAERKIRLTPLRRRVLELLSESDTAMGAYDLLPALQAEGLGSQPVVAYRALDFLIEHGLAHRIEGVNAFVACSHPSESHTPAFLVCRLCRSVAEDCVADADPALEKAAKSRGFSIEKRVVEVIGLCADCRETNAIHQ